MEPKTSKQTSSFILSRPYRLQLRRIHFPSFCYPLHPCTQNSLVYSTVLLLFVTSAQLLISAYLSSLFLKMTQVLRS